MEGELWHMNANSCVWKQGSVDAIYMMSLSYVIPTTSWSGLDPTIHVSRRSGAS